MNYKQAYQAIKNMKQNQQDPIDSFFLPLILSLGYRMSFGSLKQRSAGITIVNHQQKIIVANLSDKTQIIFYGYPNPKLKFAADKIYIYFDTDYTLIVEIPRFNSMYKELEITNQDDITNKNAFKQFIELITYRQQATDNKSMKSLQLDMDLSAFQKNQHELLQLVMFILNQALASCDMDLIKFILNKINQNYHTQYSNAEILAILQQDFKRRNVTNKNYQVVDNDFNVKASTTNQSKLAQSKVELTPEEKEAQQHQKKKELFRSLFLGNDDKKDNKESTSSQSKLAKKKIPPKKVAKTDSNNNKTIKTSLADLSNENDLETNSVAPKTIPKMVKSASSQIDSVDDNPIINLDHNNQNLSHNNQEKLQSKEEDKNNHDESFYKRFF